MTHKIKYLLLTLLAVGIISCESDDDSLAETGANAILADNAITVLDRNENLTIDLFSRNVNFQSVEIEGSNGTILGDATVSDGQATFNSSILGDLSEGESRNIWIVSTLSNGEVIRQPATISVSGAASVSAPSSLVYLDPEESLLEYSVSTFSAPVESLELQWRANDDETWIDSDITLDQEGGEIDLAALNLEDYGVGIGDTLNFRIVAESGEFSDDATASVNIVTQDFGSSTSGALSSDAQSTEFSFTQGSNFAEGSEEGEVAFVSPNGFTVVNDADISFIEVTVPEDMTAEEYAASLDLFDAETLFEQGNPVTSVDEVSRGDLYIYRTNRDGEDFYGFLIIGNVTTTTVNGQQTTSYDFQFSEGTISRA